MNDETELKENKYLDETLLDEGAFSITVVDNNLNFLEESGYIERDGELYRISVSVKKLLK
jgi:hypothetical protein